jgi:hypothetical protein
MNKSGMKFETLELYGNHGKYVAISKFSISQIYVMPKSVPAFRNNSQIKKMKHTYHRLNRLLRAVIRDWSQPLK